MVRARSRATDTFGEQCASAFGWRSNDDLDTLSTHGDPGTLMQR